MITIIDEGFITSPLELHYLHDIQTNMMPLDLNSGITNMSSRMLKIFYVDVFRYDIYSYPYGSMRFN